MTELYKLTATEAVDLLQAGEITSSDLLDAAEARIKEVDGPINALPTLCFDRARDKAKEIKTDSLLAGLPVVIKDLTEVDGVRTTFGSPIFENHISTHSDYLVERLEARGGVVYAKSNTPEFGAGANTFNPVLGTTRNPRNTKLSVAGSSGGAAAALATGTAWLAHGSDLGGSLRTPAAFNGVVGLRPSPGRVGHGPKPLCFGTLGVEGPMARNVADVALFLDALSGFEPRDPISFPAPDTPFRDAVKNPTAPKRVAFSADLGFAAVDTGVASACAEAAAGFSALGADVVEHSPDFSGGFECFQTLRAVMFAAGLETALAVHRDKMKPDVIWNVEKGMALTAEEVLSAERVRARLFHNMLAFFEDYDLLACPAMQAPPYPVEQTYVDEINGKKLDTYIDWLAISAVITLTGCPSISLPCGFDENGMPVGIQLVGKPRGEAALLSAAALFEEMMGIAPDLPIEPHVTHL
jgi:amidase